MKRYIYIFVGTVVAALSYGAFRGDHNLTRNVEILINVMREISENYVDEVDSDEMMEHIGGALTNWLDPYTQYMPEDEAAAFDILTTGKYGGIGSLIRKKGDYVVIAEPYEGSPSYDAGFKIGDKIIEIDGESAKGFSNDEVSKRLKGTPGTDVKLKLQRIVDDSEQEFTLTRRRISIPAVSYVGLVGDPADSIGYIKHDDFTAGSAEQVKQAVLQLKAQGIKGLVLDYRANGGGILQEAIDIVSLFTPKGTQVVMTKGRKDSTVLRTRYRPIAADLPLAVLISPGSASAAEIVSGAIQDLDRGVLVGQRSFGKGLVQSPQDVGYNSYLKITTARYHIPSGRCIQKIDYSDHTRTGSAKVVADSLRREFRTAAGRKVYDGGGITPDFKVVPDTMSRFAMIVYAQGFTDDFADEYYKGHHADGIDGATFSIDDAGYADFETFMADKDVAYESESRLAIDALRKAAKRDKFDGLTAQIDSLESQIKDDKASSLKIHRADLERTLNQEIGLRFGGAKSVIRQNMRNDKELDRAIEVLQDSDLYRSTLSVN